MIEIHVVMGEEFRAEDARQNVPMPDSQQYRPLTHQVAGHFFRKDRHHLGMPVVPLPPLLRNEEIFPFLK